MTQAPAGWDHPTEDLLIHALTVAVALQELDWEITPETVVKALELAEPGLFVTSMLASRSDEWAEELVEAVERASDLAARLAALDAPAI